MSVALIDAPTAACGWPMGSFTDGPRICGRRPDAVATTWPYQRGDYSGHRFACTTHIAEMERRGGVFVALVADQLSFDTPTATELTAQLAAPPKETTA